MTSDKRGLTTARKWRRLIGGAPLCLALVLIFISAAFSAGQAIRPHAGAASARPASQTGDDALRHPASDGGGYVFLQGGEESDTRPPPVPPNG